MSEENNKKETENHGDIHGIITGGDLYADRIIIIDQRGKKEEFYGGLDEIPKGYIPQPPSPYFCHPYKLQSNFTGRVEERKYLTEWFCNNPNPVASITASRVP